MSRVRMSWLEWTVTVTVYLLLMTISVWGTYAILSHPEILNK